MTRKKKKKQWTVHIEQTKKYYNFYTFTQQVLQHFFQLWLVTVSYFILTSKKLTPQ